MWVEVGDEQVYRKHDDVEKESNSNIIMHSEPESRK